MLRWIVRGALIAIMVMAAGSAFSGSRTHHRSVHARQTFARADLLAAAASLAAGSSAVVGPEASVPYGWVDFCHRYIGECDTQPLPAQNVVLTARLWQRIEKINRYVNATIQPMSDMEHWGVLDQWDYPTDGKGDCEDYALMKRQMLMQAGVPRQALLMTVVRDLQDAGHAVLTLVSDRGDYVLDNLDGSVRPWTATNYRFVKRQSQQDPNVWMTLRNDDVSAVAATQAAPR